MKKQGAYEKSNKSSQYDPPSDFENFNTRKKSAAKKVKTQA